MTIGNIHSTESFGALDGPGIRFVVFLQGCPLRCLYCHNCDTWNPADAAQNMTPQQLLEMILSYRHFIASSGVTFSGGEPLLQHSFVEEMEDCSQQKESMWQLTPPALCRWNRYKAVLTNVISFCLTSNPLMMRCANADRRFQ